MSRVFFIWLEFDVYNKILNSNIGKSLQKDKIHFIKSSKKV
jgi:hypothetical protein